MISEVPWFGLSPYAQQTMTNIIVWTEDAFDATSLEKSMIMTVAPEGAADVASAIGRNDKLKAKLGTCKNHGVARALVYAVGTEGKPSLNPEFKTALKKNGRLAELHSESKHFHGELGPELG